MNTIPEPFYVLSECYDPSDAPYQTDCYSWIQRGLPPLDERSRPALEYKFIQAGPFDTEGQAIGWLERWYIGQEP